MERREFITGLATAGGLSLAGFAEGAVTEGAQSYWPHGRKYGFVTAYDHDVSIPDLPKVWYTLTKGAITEVRFPRLDLINTTAIEFLVTDGSGYAARTYNVDKTDDGTVEDPVDRQAEMVADDALVFEQTLTDSVTDHDWTLTVEYVADTEHDALVADVTFDASSEYDLYVLGDLAMGHGTDTDQASVTGTGTSRHVVATGSTGGWITEPDGSSYNVATALTATDGFDWATVDTAGGQIADLLDGSVPAPSTSASGNVQLAGRLLSGGGSTTLAMGFSEGGDTAAATTEARDAIARGYTTVRSAYTDGWQSYLDAIDTPTSVTDDPDLLAQYNASVMSLKAGESKHAQFRGASVAAPTIPWGQISGAGSAAQTGYSHCWPRDLYHVFTALEAIGDTEGAIHSTEYLYEYQQKSDGSVKQNTTFNGKERWGAVQMDQVAYPLIMAYQLYERHGIAPSDGEVSYDYQNVALGAGYLDSRGPFSSQQRWEENGGFSPQSMAAQIAGLICAAELAELEGYPADADRWRTVADDYASLLEPRTVSDEGPFGAEYFVRVNQNYDDPDAGSTYVANGGGNHPTNEVVDHGFLELVRFGIRPADDPLIEQSLAVVDDRIRVDTPSGPGWYRYSHDGYGQEADGSPWDGTGVGRLWPFLSGERAEYELLAGGTGDLAPQNLLQTMANFANDGRMISEQVWDREEATAYDWEIGDGTGASTPLLWCSAQFARLAHCIDAGEPVEAPIAVANHFGTPLGPCPSLSVTAPDSVDAQTATISGTTGASSVQIETPNGDILEPAVDSNGNFSAQVSLSTGDNTFSVSVPQEDGTGRCDEQVTITRVDLLAQWADPADDDHGPGEYTYPTGSVFTDGDFDLTGLTIQEQGSSYRIVASLATQPSNPWGFGPGFSKQFLQLYVRDPDASGGSTTPAPGVNATMAASYHRRVLIDGENGVRVQDAAGSQVATGSVSVDGSDLVVEVPASAVGDLASAEIATLLLGYDGTNSDYTRMVESSNSEWVFGGAENDNAPQVLDLIAPEGISQSEALAYSASQQASIPFRTVSGDSGGGTATFGVSSLDTPASVTAGETITVAADVTNTGDESGTQTVELLVDGAVVDSTTGTLSPGETFSVSYEYDTSGLSAGSHTVAVATQNSTASTTIDVSASGAATFGVSNLDVPASGTVGDSITVSAEVENTGSAEGTTTAELLVDGSAVQSTDVTLSAGTSTMVSFTYDTSGLSAGAHTVAVAAGSDSVSGTIDLSSGSSSDTPFVVENFDAPGSAESGWTVYVSADIVNTGSEVATKTIEFRVDGTVVDTLDRQLYENSQSWVQFGLDTSGLSAGAHTVTIATPDDSASGEVSIS